MARAYRQATKPREPLEEVQYDLDQLIELPHHVPGKGV
jgi:hypothetical protein